LSGPIEDLDGYAVHGQTLCDGLQSDAALRADRGQEDLLRIGAGGPPPEVSLYDRPPQRDPAERAMADRTLRKILVEMEIGRGRREIVGGVNTALTIERHRSVLTRFPPET
jgi:hypothetical protein